MVEMTVDPWRSDASLRRIRFAISSSCRNADKSFEIAHAASMDGM
jgi:hypothetical protein